MLTTRVTRTTLETRRSVRRTMKAELSVVGEVTAELALVIAELAARVDALEARAG